MPLNTGKQDRFSRRLQRELAISGESPAPVTAPEIQPVIVVENERPELQHLALEHRFSATMTLGAVAGEYYYFHLWNPATSRSLLIVEEFNVCAPSTQSFDFGVANIAFYASLSGRAAYCLDARVPQNAIARPCVGDPMCGTDVNTGGIATFGRIRTIGSAMYRVLPGYVLAPGDGFGIFQPAVNLDVVGYIWWRERVAMDGELT